MDVWPSGRQLELADGEQRLVVVEVGGGLRSYRVGDRELLDGYPPEAMASAARGQHLLPWPNRIRDGAYVFDGTHQQLALTEPPARNAIHGLVRWAAWTLVRHDPHEVVLGHRLHPQPGYPFTLDLEVAYALGQDGLRVTTRARNVGPTRCPFGAGSHPYLQVGGAIDDARLRVPAATVLRSDDRGIPIGRGHVRDTPFDFRDERPVGATRLDHAMTDLERDTHGRAWVSLAGPTGPAVRLWADEAYPFLMLFTGDTLPGGGRRSLAVEPMTCAPNAFASGDGLIALEPGDAFEGAWGIDPGA